MTDPVEVRVPGPEYRADPDMVVLWNKQGVLLDVALNHLPPDAVFAVTLSRIAREMRRHAGTEAAKQVLQGFVDTMETAAAYDLPRSS
jgi:hypothetical protein